MHLLKYVIMKFHNGQILGIIELWETCVIMQGHFFPVYALFNCWPSRSGHDWSQTSMKISIPEANSHWLQLQQASIAYMYQKYLVLVINTTVWDIAQLHMTVRHEAWKSD